jgi:hypothetical protein
VTAAARPPSAGPGAEREGAPLADVMGAVDAELAELAGLADHLQAVLGPLILAQGARTQEVMRDAQALDLMSQRLQGLRDFFHGLGPSLPEPCRVEAARAARQVKLADLARRLALAEPAAPAAADDDSELDLF